MYVGVMHPICSVFGLFDRFETKSKSYTSHFQPHATKALKAYFFMKTVQIRNSDICCASVHCVMDVELCACPFVCEACGYTSAKSELLCNTKLIRRLYVKQAIFQCGSLIQRHSLFCAHLSSLHDQTVSSGWWLMFI